MSQQTAVATRDPPMTVVGKIMTNREVRAVVVNVTLVEKLVTSVEIVPKSKTVCKEVVQRLVLSVEDMVT